MWGRIAWSYSSGGKAVSARTYAQVPINSSSVWNSHWANTRNQLHVEVYPSLALPGSAFLSAESPDHRTALGCCLTLCLTCARWNPSLWQEATIFPSWQTLWQDYWLSTQYPPQKEAQGWIENPTRSTRHTKPSFPSESWPSVYLHPLSAARDTQGGILAPASLWGIGGFFQPHQRVPSAEFPRQC